MKRLMPYVRQLNQRRMTAFYLSPLHGADETAALRDQLRLESFTPTADRPRSLREMFADVEYDNDEEPL